MHIQKLQLSLVAAMTPNRVIGNNGAIPWHLPSDLTRVNRITTGIGVLVMGRKTHESILRRNGKPLPGRHTIVLSKESSAEISSSVEFVGSLEEALGAITSRGGRACILGGKPIYEMFLPFVDTAYITVVQASVPGDTFFPEGLTLPNWHNVGSFRSFRHHPNDEYETAFLEYRRVGR
ncbi:MAG: dihydrofolate reductase [Minisyncoccia bacterium]